MFTDNEGTKQEDIKKPRDREERLRMVKDRQNEERQRKLEELKNQAIAAQKYREQKEDERKRRMEELRHKEQDRKQQVDERKKAIMDAEKERREYIIRRNQERESRLETKRRQQQMSTSMYAIFNWDQANNSRIETRPKRFSLALAGSEINIDDPPNDDSTDSSPLLYRSVHRRKTDLMPTVPSPRDTSFGSKSSLYNSPRTPGDVSKQKKERPPLPKMFSTPKRQTTPAGTSTQGRSTETPKRNEKRISSSIKKATSPRPTTPVQSSKPLDVAAVTAPTVSIEETTLILSQNNPDETHLIDPSDNVIVVSQSTEHHTVEIETVPAMEQLTLKPTNDLSAANSQERVHTNEILPHQQENEMTASMIAKRYTTEEQAKAALAERRRIAREEAERQAELERQRIEAEELAEQQRIFEEEENQRRLEEETLRLVEEQKKAEELRLLQAIEEAKQKEEEERKRKETEEIARIEREETERKAREEAEKQKIETAEKLRKEEKEREERRKRVEAIMSRTRKSVNSGNTQNKDGNVADQMSPSNSDNDLVKTSTNENNFTTQKDSIIASYELSVTNKENALMNNFSHLIEHQSHPTLNIQEFNAQNAKANGKTESDAINDGNLLIKSAISNGNGHNDFSLDNELDSKKFSAVENKTQEITGQLIDINIDFNESSTPVNFNNNSLLTTTTLVTSDSPESKDLSLL
ncbi:hypothetical protein Bhyg_15126 [Pseudolycoriella hygida]|uniref:Ensconsin-like n=1 Tax=Pseudolycoriella hygida TaxID=35572 RepID=A0A9Q0RWA3_9DIPT|nr:hypothetical protein Bhyg_15126 [Pseudolycoriella hygida]